MHKYNPRGLIKWAPFSALTKYEQEVVKMYEEFNTIHYELNEDKISFIKEQLNIYYLNNSPCTLVFIENNNLIEIEGKIDKLEVEYFYLDENKFMYEQVYDIY